MRRPSTIVALTLLALMSARSRAVAQEEPSAQEPPEEAQQPEAEPSAIAADPAEGTADEVQAEHVVEPDALGETREPADEPAPPPDEGGIEQGVIDDGAPPAEPRGVYVQGRGRGFLYGAHVGSPVLLGEVVRAGGAERLPVGGGAAIRARFGWELPVGFSIEAYGGLAVNGIDTLGRLEHRSTVLRFDFGLGARYAIFFDSIFVPFVELGVGLAWYTVQWPSGDTNGGAMTLPLRGALGAHLELAPYFGLELGVAIEYAVALDGIADGLVTLTPFLGVTLYVDDPDDPI